MNFNDGLAIDYVIAKQRLVGNQPTLLVRDAKLSVERFL
jgi:hypothetical protein